MNPVRCVLFDLDGTLIDSAPDLGDAANAVRHTHGLPPLPDAAYRPHAGAGARGMLHAAFGLQPNDPGYEALKLEILDQYERRMNARTRPFDGVEPLIAALQQQQLRWGIVTNKAERFTHPLVAALPLLASASTVVSGDTTAHLKPHPAALLEALRRLSLPVEHCIYVGDDERDIQAGRAAGMRTIAVRYGYLTPDRPIEQWGADAIIEHPLQLLNWLNLA